MSFYPTNADTGSGVSELCLDAELAAITQWHGSDNISERVTQLFVLLRVPVYRYVLSIVGNAAEAEDVTQDSFLKLYRSLLEGMACENARFWVFRVAHNTALDRQKGARFISPLNPSEWDQIVANRRDCSPNPEQSIIEREKFQSVRTGLARLSAQQQHIMQLRAEGLRYREIGEVLGIGTTTVADSVHRAVQTLKAELDA